MKHNFGIRASKRGVVVNGMTPFLRLKWSYFAETIKSKERVGLVGKWKEATERNG